MLVAAGRRLANSPTLMTWGSLAVRLSGVIVVLPVVLRRFPVAEVAVWQLFATILTLVTMLDLGLAPSFSRLFAYARGGATLDEMADMRTRGASRSTAGAVREAPDAARIEATLARLSGALHWVYPRMAMLAIVLMGAAGTWVLRGPVSHCVHPLQMWTAWGVVLAGAVAAILGNASAAALQGLDEVARQRRVEVLTGGAQALCSVAAVMASDSLLVLVLAYQAWGLATAVLNRRLLARVRPAMAAAPARRDAEVLRVLWPTAWRSGVGVLASQGVIQASGLVYGALAAPAALASYLLALRLVTVASQISQAPFYSKLPRLAALYAAGDRDALVALASRGVRWSQWVLCLGLAAGAFVLPAAVQALGSRTPFVSPGLWALLCAAFVVERFGAMHMQLYSLSNHIVWHLANGATGLLMVALSAAGFPLLGLAAFPLAMLVSYALVYSAWAARWSGRLLGFRWWAFEARAGAPAAAVLALALAASLWVLPR